MNEGTWSCSTRDHQKSAFYQAKEGCLSLPGVREAGRWKSIKTQYQTGKVYLSLGPVYNVGGIYFNSALNTPSAMRSCTFEAESQA